MRVLWITNIIFPVVSETLGLTTTVFGGWMTSSLTALRESSQESSYAVATIYKGDDLKVLKKDSVVYYLLPTSKNSTIYDKSLESIWQRIQKDFKPDVVHIHGTEYAHGLAYIRACGAKNVCVSIQGLVSIYSQYYYAGIHIIDIVKNITFRDIVKFDTLFQQRRKFERRGELEKEYLKSVSHIIGRTSWDKAHSWAVNPKAKYHLCNETLRTSFYKHRWSYDRCEKYTIFLSQASYPIKGLHIVMEAMSFVLRHFPDTRIRVAGDNIIDKPFYRISGYGKYIRSLMKKLNLEDKVTFLGTLTEEQICQEYLKANVFICPSAIENSPNSLGEAQILGVPSLASYVGGTSDMMVGNEEHLYRFEEVEMLAYSICSIFQKKGNDYIVSPNQAMKRHNVRNNSRQLIEIYNTIIANQKLL